MAVELKVPSVGESIKEVELGDWLKKVGDKLKRDEAVVVIESDKATVEISAPVGGTLSKILKKKGEKATVGEIVGYMEEGAAGETSAAVSATKPAETKSTRPDTIVMPSARRALAEHHLSADQVEPTGPGGRMLKEDVLRQIESKPATVQAPEQFAPAPASRQEEVVRMTPMRRRIAERLVQAQQNAALLTTFNEVDMSNVMALRNKHKDAFLARYGTKLGFMSFFVKAAVDALKLVPQVNAEIRGEDVVYHNFCDIGIAVGGGKGLVVPILRNAERMSFAEIELKIADFGKRAQENKIGLDELKGGTFTISNGGVYGSLLSTPIVNPPQSGILGLHTIQERPIALAGQVVIRPMMYLALTYDHRIIDGKEGVTFLKRLKDSIEEPSRMLLEI